MMQEAPISSVCASPRFAMPASKNTNRTDIVPVTRGSETFRDAAGMASNKYAKNRTKSCETHKDIPRTKQTAPPVMISVMYALATSDIRNSPLLVGQVCNLRRVCNPLLLTGLGRFATCGGSVTRLLLLVSSDRNL